MTIALQILFTTGWKELAELVLPIAKSYCERHGYKFVNVEYPEPCNSDFGYNKLVWIKRLFQEGIDAVWSIDLDTLICNDKIQIEQYLDEEHDIYFTKDYNGLNCGSFIVKNTEWTKEFLDKALMYQGMAGMHCEQNAFEQLLGDEKIKILPQKTINAYLYDLYPEIGMLTEDEGQFVEHKSLLLHLPGISYKKRLEIISHLISRLKYE